MVKASRTAQHTHFDVEDFYRALHTCNVVMPLVQEIRAGDKQRARSLFERATHLSLPPKKMKFLFKRYLDFEKAHGDAAGVEHVKQAAKEYVEANLAEQ